VIVYLTGIAAGLVHVLTGPDHLAALTPLAASRPRQSVRAGVEWGLGHTGGVALVALLGILLRGLLPLDRLSSWSERGVGVVLIAIGIWGLRSALSSRMHAHVHDHDGHPHAHVHVHTQPHTASPISNTPPHRHSHAAFGVGILHGLAGSSHFLGVLPALALPSAAAAGMYVLGFGSGSVAAMAAYSACVGAIALRTHRGPAQAYRWLLGGAATAALVVGCFWLRP
jgi:ABC-type nickel/cobalt efflux system permease component RcnA